MCQQDPEEITKWVEDQVGSPTPPICQVVCVLVTYVFNNGTPSQQARICTAAGQLGCSCPECSP